MTKHAAHGNKVMLVFYDGESRQRAVCNDAQRAADMLNKAAYLNDTMRRYTAAARLIASVELLPGFQWTE